MNGVFSRLRLARALPVLAVLILLLTALKLASDATSAVTRSGESYLLVLGLAAVGLLILFAALARRVYRIVRALRRGEPGSRLSARLALIFVALSVPPALIVYWFSLQFLSEGIDSWFDVRLESAMEDALELGQVYLDTRERQAVDRIRRLARQLGPLGETQRDAALEDFLDEYRARHVAVFGQGGRILHAATLVPRAQIPEIPDEVIMLQVLGGRTFARAEPGANGRLQIRALAPVTNRPFGAEPTIVQTVFGVPEEYSDLAENVETEYLRYEQLGFLRTALKQSFILILSLVLMFGVLLAMLLAINTARRLVAPIGRLAVATEEVAGGRYDRQLDIPSDDELGFLVRSFNHMTSEISRARTQEQESRNEIDDQRRYLETLLQSLSSGVLSLTADNRIRTSNDAAGDILKLPIADCLDQPLDRLAEIEPTLQPFVDLVASHADQDEWRAELVLDLPNRPLVLMCRGARLPGTDAGRVLVFDDTTVLNQAQRDAAWGEVARRLAHEVKNPLTPIQLAADRLQHKFMAQLASEDQQTFARLTHTISVQVEALKTMVNEFSDYARPPRLERRVQSVNDIAREVGELYAGRDLEVVFELCADEPLVAVDAVRLRQLLNNLLKNAQEATANQGQSTAYVRTEATAIGNRPALKLEVADNGPGLPEGLEDRVFEPYATTKARGTGLGLAIVKKIVEEHGGRIEIGADEAGGARVSCWFPTDAPQAA